MDSGIEPTTLRSTAESLITQPPARSYDTYSIHTYYTSNVTPACTYVCNLCMYTCVPTQTHSCLPHTCRVFDIIFRYRKQDIFIVYNHPLWKQMQSFSYYIYNISMSYISALDFELDNYICDTKPHSHHIAMASIRTIPSIYYSTDCCELAAEIYIKTRFHPRFNPE